MVRVPVSACLLGGRVRCDGRVFGERTLAEAAAYLEAFER
jgi:hypothetical protein